MKSLMKWNEQIYSKNKRYSMFYIIKSAVLNVMRHSSIGPKWALQNIDKIIKSYRSQNRIIHIALTMISFRMKRNKTKSKIQDPRVITY